MIPPIISVEILESILTVAGSLLVPLVGERFGLKKLLHWPKRDNSNAPIDLLQRLQAASSEMDSVISELRKAAEDRSKKVSELEASIKTLAEKEASLKEQIAGTEGMSIATANTFARIVDEQLQKSERPAKRRDYSLFAAGVVVSALVGIGIEVTKPLWKKPSISWLNSRRCKRIRQRPGTPKSDITSDYATRKLVIFNRTGDWNTPKRRKGVCDRIATSWA